MGTTPIEKTISGETIAQQVEEGKTCFIITPIGDDGTPTRRETDGLIDRVLWPVLENSGFTDIKVSHRMDNSGSITNQIIQRIYNDDLVVANLTGLNPNVMYELAIRHHVLKPVVHLCEKSTRLPFDIAQERTIFYINDFQGSIDLEKEFQAKVDSAMTDGKTDNPISRAVQISRMLQDKNLPSFQKLVLEKLETLADKVNHNSLATFIEPKPLHIIDLEVKFEDEEELIIELRKILAGMKVTILRTRLNPLPDGEGYRELLLNVDKQLTPKGINMVKELLDKKYSIKNIAIA